MLRFDEYRQKSFDNDRFKRVWSVFSSDGEYVGDLILHSFGFEFTFVAYESTGNGVKVDWMRDIVDFTNRIKLEMIEQQERLSSLKHGDDDEGC
jgi:hypothetical protein